MVIPQYNLGIVCWWGVSCLCFHSVKVDLNLHDIAWPQRTTSLENKYEKYESGLKGDVYCSSRYHLAM